MKLPFGLYIGRKKEPERLEQIPERRVIHEPTLPSMSKYEFDKLCPKSWKGGIWMSKPWKQKGISWNAWRSNQADHAVDYYIESGISQQDCADKFGISINAFTEAWRWYKKKNGLECLA